MKAKLGIIGLGSVGKALKHTLDWFYETVVYDIVGEYRWQDILNTDAVFVCVQTPEGADGRLDCSHVDEVLERLSEDNYTKPVVIRSTLRIGYMDKAKSKYPSLRLLYVPEFLRERSSFQWSVCPDRIVIAGADEDVEEVLRYFSFAEDAQIIRTDYRSAEVGKLAHNAFIATKVSFTNEIEWICSKVGADANLVMEVVAADRRVKSKEHLRPFLGPYGG
jgi:UDPglucose 6-dehydrogenase